MGKIFLRKAEGDTPIRPYTFTTDVTNASLEGRLGDIVVYPTLMGEEFVVGLSRRGDYAIQVPLGTIQDLRKLTQKVYHCAVEYGKILANLMPERLEFIDETGGPRKIEIPTLGGQNINSKKVSRQISSAGKYIVDAL